MTGQEVINQVRQIMADKLSQAEIVDQQTFLSTALGMYVLPDLVTKHDWSWKFNYVDYSAPASTWNFFPDLTSLGNGVLMDDLHTIVFKTGNLGTTKVCHQRNPRWFLERYPDPSIEPEQRAEYCTMIGGTGGRQEIWLSCPTDAAYTLRLFLLKTFTLGDINAELPLRPDKHMLLVAGLASWGYASFEQLMGADREGVSPSPAVWWQKLYLDGMEAWWNQDQAQTGVKTELGFYHPRGSGPDVGEYWKDPFTRGVR